MYDNEWDGSSVQSRSIDRDVRSVASTDFRQNRCVASIPWVGDGRKGTNSAGDDHSYTSTFMVDGVVSFCLPLFFSIRAFVTATLSRREAFVLLPKDCGSYP